MFELFLITAALKYPEDVISNVIYKKKEMKTGIPSLLTQLHQSRTQLR